MERNIRQYPVYAGLFNALFWMPVFFLFFDAHLPLQRVLQLEAVYYAAVVLLEVPSGYFSDRVGRRATLLASGAALALAYGLFVASSTFVPLAVAQTLLAAGIAFNSGTDTSLHYDSLVALDRVGEYGAREARATRMGFLAGAGAAIAGGLAGAYALRAAYGLSLIAALAMLVVVYRFREPPRESGYAVVGMRAQVGRCLRDLRNPALAWLFGFAVLMTVLNHVPYELYQPYLGLLGQSGTLPLPGKTPVWTGVHMAATMLIGSWVAGRSEDLRVRFGAGPTLLSSTALQVVIIGLMAAAVHPVIGLLVVLRGVPRALMAAPLNAEISPRVPSDRRATYLSLQSLVGRLSFSIVLLLLSAAAGSATDWESLRAIAGRAGILGSAGFLVLLTTLRAANLDAGTRKTDTP